MKMSKKILVFLFPSLILFAFLGRGLFNIDYGLVLILFFMQYKTVNFRTIVQDKLFVGWSLFVLFVTLSLPFAHDFLFSFKKYIVFVLYSFVGLIIALWLYIYDSDRYFNIKTAIKVLIFSIIIMEFITIFNVISGFDLIHYISHHFEKIPQGGRYHLREVFTAMIFFLVLDYFMQNRSLKNFLFLFIPILGILASTSRTAIVALVVGGIAYIFAYTKKIFSKELIALLLVLFATFGISYTAFPEIRQRLESFKTTFSPHGDRMSNRYDVYLDTLQRIKIHPIFGHGIKSGVVYAKEGKALGKSVKHSHNIYLEILLDTGVIGFFGFLIFLRYFYLYFKPYLFDSAFVGVMSAIFLSSLVSWSIWSVNHISLVLILIVLVAGYLKTKKRI